MASKSRLQFILNPEPPSPEQESGQSQLWHKLTSPVSRRAPPAWRASVAPIVWQAATPAASRPSSVLVALVRKKRAKKKTHKSPRKRCSEPDCTSRAVSRGRCVRHGGGSRCTFPECTNGAKIQARCFQHGGSTACMEDGCTSKAKRYGYCWAHGGGRICSERGCTKVAAPGGLCWAHGGGNRCRAPGCSTRSYQMYSYYCKSHASRAAPTDARDASCSSDSEGGDETMEEKVEGTSD